MDVPFAHLLFLDATNLTPDRKRWSIYSTCRSIVEEEKRKETKNLRGQSIARVHIDDEMWQTIEKIVVHMPIKWFHRSFFRSVVRIGLFLFQLRRYPDWRGYRTDELNIESILLRISTCLSVLNRQAANNKQNESSSSTSSTSFSFFWHCDRCVVCWLRKRTMHRLMSSIIDKVT